MTPAAACPSHRISRIHGVLMVLLAVLMAFVLVAPHAEAAKKQRIIAISPFAAQALVQMGVKPIAVGATIGATTRQQKMLSGIPKLALSHPNGPNLEVLARKKPDIVFSSDRWKAGTPAMKRLGIRVVYADPTSPNGVKPNVLKIGRVVGRQKQAVKLNRRITSGLRNAIKGIGPNRKKILVVLGIGRTAMAFLGNSWGGNLVTQAGGNLVTGGATAGGGFARLSDEVVVAENPDVIVVVPHGNSGDLSQVRDYILNNEAWKTTNAFKTKQVFVSIDNTLLQAGTDLGPVVSSIRTDFLKNR